MEDIFEKMMESSNLRAKRRRLVKRKLREDSEEGGDLVASQLREATGGGSRGTGISPDGAWTDLEHAITASGGRRLETEVNEEDGWSGESYDEDFAPSADEEF